jgi:2-C-methyl-D-erythritol 2,4-cyclodiphosphate synthase
MRPQIRVGIGYDAHRFSPNRKLILGGITIPYTQGLLGHSDADVLTHTIMDALLGALSLGSIGDHFPDTDPKFKDADSIQLLTHVYQLIKDQGYLIQNIDAVLVAQQPKLAPHIPKMRSHLATVLSLEASQVGIKATTTEKMGPEGRLEGMSCQAVVLVYKGDSVA